MQTVVCDNGNTLHHLGVYRVALTDYFMDFKGDGTFVEFLIATNEHTDMPASKESCIPKYVFTDTVGKTYFSKWKIDSNKENIIVTAYGKDYFYKILQLT